MKLPITHLTLYKNGVGFFERRAQFQGSETRLSFRVEEMNDILKSLTVIEHGTGKVLSVDYATPQTLEERLAGCSIRLNNTRSLRDLLIGLRGRGISLNLKDGKTLDGTLIGLDEPATDQPLEDSLVSVVDDRAHVTALTLGQVAGLQVRDPRAADDLRFFLETSLTQENYRQVNIRLTPGEHDLSLHYVAPAPNWRVSYRLAAETSTPNEAHTLLMGWGIFDNHLEEDLQNIRLTLVAGMPISFIYDLYTPFTPERPQVKDESRVAPAPATFAAATPPPAPANLKRGAALRAPVSAMGMEVERSAAFNLNSVAKSTDIQVETHDQNERFAYAIATPVSVGRGQSAMVPILMQKLPCRKDLLYNGSKTPQHPVASLRLKNQTGLTLERGPLTVIENGEYAGEAILPFSANGSEMVIAYAVELGVTVHENSQNCNDLRSISVQKGYFLFEEWHILGREYLIENQTEKSQTILIEHPHNPAYALFDSPAPKERTAEFLRFEVTCAPRTTERLLLFERRLLTRREEVRKHNLSALKKFFKDGLLNEQVFKKLEDLWQIWDEIASHEEQLRTIEREREKIYKSQTQIQGNLNAIKTDGAEAALRTRYVQKLNDTENQLETLASEENREKSAITLLEQRAAAMLAALG